MTFDWAGVTTVHPVGLALMLVCALLALVLKRNYAFLPLILMVIAIPSAQRIVLVDIDFSFVRIIVLVTLFRIYLRKEYRGVKFQAVDWLSFGYAFWGVISYGILFQSFGVMGTRAGYMVDAVGSYWVGRILFRNFDDLKRLLQVLAVASVPVFAVFSLERMTGRNFFAEFGGVPKYTLIRDGRLRCQGPFLHPIMAGVFWASFMPWIASYWKARQMSRGLLVVFLICAVGIVVNTASSTPIMTLIFSALGIGLFVFYRFLTPLRWGVIFMLFMAHLLMEKPIWHLIARIDVAGGSTGWHRYHLIDKAITFFDEWWLVGTWGTSHWGYGLRDVTNQFILEGVRSGALGMLLFASMLLFSFRGVRKAIGFSNDRGEKIILWSCSVVLGVHALNFIAVSYFGQMTNAFFLTLGICTSVPAFFIISKKRERKAEYLLKKSAEANV